MIIRHQFRCHIGAGTYYNSVICHTFVHINNTAIGFGQIVHQARTLFCGMNGHYQTICLDRTNLQITCCTLMNGYQIFQAFLYCFRITRLSVGEADTILQRDLPCQIVYQFISFCNPRLQFHGIINLHQRLADTVTHASPSAVGTVRVNIGFLILRIECGITKDKSLFSFLDCLCLCGSICTLCFV